MSYLRRKSYWDLQIRQSYRPHRNVHHAEDRASDLRELLYQWWMWAHWQGILTNRIGGHATRHAPLA